jgi:hypothetical protein
MELFEITRRSSRPVRSLLTPATAYPRGTAMQESATAGTAELADGTKPFAGFMTRASKVGGPDLGDITYPGRLDLPFATGEEGTFEFAEEVEAEGSDYVDAGITAGTTLKTPLTFLNGKFYIAASTNLAEFVLVELPTPRDAGNVRIRAVPIDGWIKP